MPNTNPELTAKQIKVGWEQTFSTNNPFCPCDLKSFTKAVNWAERALAATAPNAGAPLSDELVYAVMLNGKREALSSLPENAEHAARSMPGAVVVAARLIAAAPAQQAGAALTADQADAIAMLLVGASGRREPLTTEGAEAIVKQVLAESRAFAAPAAAAQQTGAPLTDAQRKDLLLAAQYLSGDEGDVGLTSTDATRVVHTLCEIGGLDELVAAAGAPLPLAPSESDDERDYALYLESAVNTEEPEFSTVGAMHKCRTGGMFSECVACGATDSDLAKPCPKWMGDALAQQATLPASEAVAWMNSASLTIFSGDRKRYPLGGGGDLSTARYMRSDHHDTPLYLGPRAQPQADAAEPVATQSALLVACPHCSAGVGEPCRWPETRTENRDRPHKARAALVDAAQAPGARGGSDAH